ncbi:alpha/beta fold hydrolase [Microbacteriaceae bacterium VKM Ac-2855]|nr:alpha/beta fold hydrolase [Microbacteriaceae bacterium VKM Ac-2855]
MTVPSITLRALGGEPTQPLLVLGCSLGTSSILWEEAAPLLATRCRLLVWDLPGHGDSPPASAPFSVADLADAVAASVDGPFFYAGVSLGGAVGLELLLRHGDRVPAAAIIAAGAQLGDPGSWHDRAALVRARSTSSIIIGSAQRWFAPESIARHPDLSGRLLHALQDADDESYARCCEALAAHDVRGSLGRITAPVLALWGEHDTVAPETKAAEIAAGVARGATAEIGGCAHLPPAEQPEATADALLSYFDNHSEEVRS